MIQKIKYIITSILVGLFIAGCHGGDFSTSQLPVSEVSSGPTGSVQINFKSVNYRLIITETDLEPYTYVIEGYGPGGAAFTRSISADQTSVTVNSLVIGEWVIVIEALNEDNVSIAGGDAVVKVRTRQTAACSISVSPFEGQGILDLDIMWDPGILQNPLPEITLERKGYDPFEVSYTIDAVHGRANVYTELDTGYYTVTVRLYDSTGPIQEFYGGAADVARIINGQTAAGSINIEKNANPGEPADIGDLEEPSFPSPGAPEGSDAVSASTNQSGASGESTAGLNPLAGAMYIAAPKVNKYGTVELDYPLEVPKGRAGMNPAVSLVYSSGNGDGIVGMGWILSTGLGNISRSTRYGEVYYDQRDTFTFNGSRLVRVDGPAGSELGVYRLEIETGFSRYELVETNKGRIWRVYDKTGCVTIYGEDKSARIYSPDDESRIFTWSYSRSYDLNGNFMYAVYDTSQYADNHVSYLKEIRYTGNYNKSTPARQFVRFKYANRDDYYVTKAAGFIMKFSRLLDTIEIGWDDPRSGIMGGRETILWKYNLVYEISGETYRPFLKTVNSNRQTTSPEFEYQKANHYFTWQNVTNRFYSSSIYPRGVKYFNGDFNGDGMTDTVIFDPKTGYWSAIEPERGGGFNFPRYGERFRGYDSEAKIQFFRAATSGDYNGDGRCDIAFYLPETKEFYIAEHNGSTFNFIKYGEFNLTGIDIFKCKWFPGDFDGNSLSDVIFFNEPTGEWIFMANTGADFEFTKIDVKFQNLYRDDYAPDVNFNSSHTADSSTYGKNIGKVHFFSGDYNGDGRVDISMYDERNGRWWVAENKTPHGRGDFYLEWSIYREFSAPEQALFANENFLGDFNGDGFSDFLLFDREKGEWILGKTLDGTIEFEVFGKAPQYKDITRWIQGDFNGDGRTDIGFYSDTGRKFWIGEATPDGFNYAVYSGLTNGPDPGKVLRTPLPKDEVKINTDKAIVTSKSGQATSIVKYTYDGNYYAGKGEKVFAGQFKDKPGMLIYRSNTVLSLNEGWTYQEAGSSGDPVNIDSNLKQFNPDDPNTTVLNNGKPFNFTGRSDGILYYKKEGGNHKFYVVNYKRGAGWNIKPVGSISTEELPGFKPQDDLYFTDDFNDTGEKDTLLIYKPAAKADDEPQFVMAGNTPDASAVEIYYREYPYPETILSADNDGIPEEFKVLFYSNAYAGGTAKFFPGNFDFGPETKGRILVVFYNATAGTYSWYLGDTNIEDGKIVFQQVQGDASFEYTGYTGRYNTLNNEVIYETSESGRITFHSIYFSAGSIASHDYAALDPDVTSRGEYDYLGNPIIYEGSATKYFDIEAGNVKDINTDNPGADPYIASAEVKRNDLIENYYPYEWLQGDFNGDNKTDIGIFDLGEDKFYFANTEGTVPGLLTRVHNGIGGEYTVSYINSSALDNTGSDGLQHLPMNIKLCNRLAVSDGRGGEIVINYQYRGGYIFSGFVNGKKEVDFFGFNEFTAISPYNTKTTSKYHTNTFSDYRKNRALAGSLKETRFTGGDGRECSRTEYQYRLHEIKPDGFSGTASWLIEPAEVKYYSTGVLTKTTTSKITLAPGEYTLISKEGATTDHFGDRAGDDEYGVHRRTTVAGRVEFENIEETNEMRTKREINFPGTTHENMTVYSYDGRGNLVKKMTEYTGKGLDPVEKIVIEYEYDGFGNLVKARNKSGSPAREAESSYGDESGLYQYVTEKRVYNGTEYIKTSVKVNYGTAFGSIDEVTDPNGNKSYFDYDNYGRMIRQKADTNYGDRRVLSEYVYDTGFPMSAKVIQYTATTDPAKVTRIYADGRGRVIHTVASAGPNNAGRKYVKSGRLIYDEVGRVIRKSQTDWALDDEIDVFRPNTKEKYSTRYEYDSSGRFKKTTQPAAFAGEPETSVTYQYNDPYEVITTHSIGRSKRVVMNGRGQILYVEEEGTGDDGKVVSAKTGFAYDLAGNRIKKMDLASSVSGAGALAMELSVDRSLFYPGVQDDSGYNIAQWKYDGYGRVKAGSDPDLGYSQVEYNSFGEVVARKDAIGRITRMCYDRLGRLTVKTLPGGEGTVKYTYDRRDGSANSLGRLVEVSDPAQTKIFSYDKFGRIKKEVRQIKDAESGETVSSGVFETSFDYDLLGRTRSIYYPEDPRTGSAITVKYRYSASGVTGIEFYNNAGRKNIVAGVLYNEFGQMTKVTRGNDTSTEYIYDIKGRLARLITSDKNSKRIQDVEYNFKVDNTLSSTTNTPDIDFTGAYESSISYNYKYDGLNRLIGSTGSYERVNPATSAPFVSRQYSQGFTYAPNGNILSKSSFKAEQSDAGNTAEDDTWNYNYDNNNHAVTSIDTANHGAGRFEMHYNAAGNMVMQRDNANALVKDMEYDSSNRITKVSDSSGTIIGTYWYDSQGFRVRKLARREVAGEDRLVEVLYPSMYFGIELQRTSYGEPIPETAYAVNNIYMNGVRVAAVIPSGDARYYLTDQVDSVKVVLDDSGKPVANIEYLPYGETWFQEGEESHNPKYNSQELDKETGFYFYNARHYAPQISRFVTPDTIIDGVYSTQGWNRYSYCGNNPVVSKDPTGHFAVPTFSISKDSISVGVNFGSFGFGVNYGWGKDPYVGGYLEVGPHVGPAGTFIQVGANYYYKSEETVGYVSGSYGVNSCVGVNSTAQYNITKHEYMGGSVGVSAKYGYINGGLSANFDKKNKYQGYTGSVGPSYTGSNFNANGSVGITFDRKGGYKDWSISGSYRGTQPESGVVENAPEAEESETVDEARNERIKEALGKGYSQSVFYGECNGSAIIVDFSAGGDCTAFISYVDGTPIYRTSEFGNNPYYCELDPGMTLQKDDIIIWTWENANGKQVGHAAFVSEVDSAGNVTSILHCSTDANGVAYTDDYLTPLLNEDENHYKNVEIKYYRKD